MKAEFPRKALEQAVRTVGGVVPSRTPKDILKSILITVKDDIAEIFATDSENSIVAYVRGVNCIQPGQVLMPWQRFADILAVTLDDVIKLVEDDRSAQIKCGRSEFRVQTGSPSEFPPQSAVEFGEDYYTVEGSVFAKQIRRSAPFCDSASSRYALGGVCFNDLPKESTFQIAATDAKRMTISKMDYTKTGDPQSASSVIPRSVCDLLARGVGENPVDIRIGPNDAQFRSGDFTWTCRLVQGRFPDPSKITLPYEGPEIELVTEPLRLALKQVGVMTSRERVGIKMTFTDDTLTINGDDETGKAEATVPITFQGETSIRVDCAFLSECLRHIDDKSFMCQICAESGVKLTLSDQSRFIIMGLSEVSP